MTLAPRAELDSDNTQGARVVRIPPPLYFGAAFAAGLVLRHTGAALSFGTAAPGLAFGAAVVATGATLTVTGIAQVHRARTTIVPHRPVTTLLTRGAYRITRNPMYTGLAIAYLGAIPLAGSWWPLLTWPLALLAVRVLVIGPEERYLIDHFGQPYLDYQAQVRRWLQPIARHRSSALPLRAANLRAEQSVQPVTSYRDRTS